MMTLSRTDRSLLSAWWWTVDRWTLALICGLIAIGVILSLAASPAVAQRLDYDTFHFVYRHLSFLLPAVLILFTASLMTPQQVLWAASVAFVAGLGLMVAALLFGEEIKGAHRWLQIGPMSLQPSEFVKPAFVVLAAWAFAHGRAATGLPGALVSAAIFAPFAALLVLQPDYGQTLLVGAVWCGLFFLSGASMVWLWGIGGAGALGAFAAYTFESHVRSRVDRFLDPETGDNYQAEMARQALAQGGFFGVGPGEGQVKFRLPDAHTDFVFAAAAEEFGLIVCLAIAGIFFAIVMRGFARAQAAPDRFVQLAGAGLIALFGAQALINICVNIGLIPAKGMTLPFVSYGGSSLLALAFGMGMALAMTRLMPTTPLGRMRG